MNNSNQIIEEFKGGMGAVAGGDSFGSGAFGGSRGSSSRSPSSISQGGSRQYGSSGYASVNPITGSMSGLANRQPGSNSGLGIVKPGAKTGTYTGGSFGGNGQYVVGFPGIKPGSNLPASSEPSLYMKPKPIEVEPRFFNGQTVQDVTLPYGHIDKHSSPGIPGPRIGNKYDNVIKNRATKIRGLKFPYGVDLKDKNLTGYYGVDDVNFVNTIQNQIATQIATQNLEKEVEQEKNQPIEEINNDFNEKKEDTKQMETFQNVELDNKQCNKNNILIVLVVILIIYLILFIINK